MCTKNLTINLVTFNCQTTLIRFHSSQRQIQISYNVFYSQWKLYQLVCDALSVDVDDNGQVLWLDTVCSEVQWCHHGAVGNESHPRKGQGHLIIITILHSPQRWSTVPHQTTHRMPPVRQKLREIKTFHDLDRTTNVPIKMTFDVF